MLLLVDRHHLDLDLVAQLQMFLGMGDPAPGYVVHVEETVNPAQVDEGAVVGDALHETVNYLAVLDVIPEFLPLSLLFLLDKHAPRDDDVRLLLVDLDHLVLEVTAYKRGGVLDRLDVDLRYGQKGSHPYIDHEPALHLG